MIISKGPETDLVTVLELIHTAVKYTKPFLTLE